MTLLGRLAFLNDVCRVEVLSDFNCLDSNPNLHWAEWHWTVPLHKLNDVTKCKDGFKMAETLAIIPLWYGMVWCGGAEQFFSPKIFYIEVREIDFTSTGKFS